MTAYYWMGLCVRDPLRISSVLRVTWLRRATWNQAASGVAWTQGGANGSGDRESALRSVVRVNAAPGQTVAFDLTALRRSG